MSATSYQNLINHVTVCISGTAGKTEVFNAAGRTFGLNVNGVEDFYYPLNEDTQVHFLNVTDIENLDVTTPYARSLIIILVYNPTVETSLDDVCQHYTEVIKDEYDMARIILLRNNFFNTVDNIAITQTDEENTLTQTHVGADLFDAISRGVIHLYKVLTPNDENDNIEYVLRELILDMIIPRAPPNNEPKSCCCIRCWLCFLRCCSVVESQETLINNEE